MEKKVNPELKDMLSVMPALKLDNLEELRSSMGAMDPSIPTNEAISISDRIITRPDDQTDLRVRIYEPKERVETLPGLLWIHGGGYVIGVPEMDEALCQRYVEEANCVVVSVDYRLAPEHPYPAPLEDCYTALKWFHDNATELDVDSSKLAIAGASAGGGLAAALSLLARDRQGPAISFQMALYPMIDDRNVTPSSYEITDERMWNRDNNLKGWDMYLGSNDREDISPYAAPARATDFTGLPPTYTCVGDLDPFRDETIEYITKLRQAGVPTEFHLYPGCFHGFEGLVPQAEISVRAKDEYVQALKRALQNGK